MDQQEKASRRNIYLQAGVLIDDPMTIEGLVISVDPSAIPESGIPFDTSVTTGRKVDCALCGRSGNHFRGFVVTFENGERAIIGRDCGERELFNQGAWKQMAAKAERRKLEALYEARSAPTVVAIDGLSEPLSRCTASAEMLSSLLREVDLQLPELHRALTGHAGRGGQLIHYTPDRQVFATIPPLAPFTSAFRNELLRVQQGLDRARQILDQPDGLTMNDQSEAFHLLKSSKRAFEAARGTANRAAVLLTHRFWSGVVAWVELEPGAHANYDLSHRVITRSGDDGAVSVTLPPKAAYSLEAFDEVLGLWPSL